MIGSIPITAPRVGRVATEIAHKSSNQLLVGGKSSNVLAATYLYFAAILLGVNLPLSSLAGITEFQIRSRYKDLLTSFKITIKVKPQTYKRHHE